MTGKRDEVGGSRSGSVAAALSGDAHIHSLFRIKAGGYNQDPKTEKRTNKTIKMKMG